METVLIQPTVEMPQQAELLAENRRQFIDALLQKELISPEFATSNMLDRFNIDQATGVDALPHILVGDGTGGFHHAPTAAALGLSRSVGSWVRNPDASMKHVPWAEQYANLKEKQAERPNGVYYAKHIGIGTGEIDPSTGVERISMKSGGSNMFPNTWTTQRVLMAIAETVNVGLGRLSKEGDRYIHNHTVDGVPIQVMTRVVDGKIIVAYPMKV